VTTLTNETRRFADGVLQSNENDNHRSGLIMKNSQQKEWNGSPDPCDPDNYWIDDETNERVSLTGERTLHDCLLRCQCGADLDDNLQCPTQPARVRMQTIEPNRI